LASRVTPRLAGPGDCRRGRRLGALAASRGGGVSMNRKTISNLLVRHGALV